MGEAEIRNGELIIHSHIITYGNAANAELAEQMREEIGDMWNEPAALISRSAGLCSLSPVTLHVRKSPGVDGAGDAVRSMTVDITLPPRQPPSHRESSRSHR